MRSRLVLIVALLLACAVPARAAFPTVATENGGGNAATTSHTINLPSGIVSGDLLVAYMVLRGNETFTWPGGWTVVLSLNQSTLSKTEIAFRRADGGEGASITVTTSGGALTSAFTTYRITGHHTTSDPEGTIITDTSGNQDPPSHTASWGAEDNLWFASAHWDNGDREVIGYSTNYTNGRHDRLSDLAANAALASARRELNTATENPGGIDVEFGVNATVATLVIRPASGAAAVRRKVVVY